MRTTVTILSAFVLAAGCSRELTPSKFLATAIRGDNSETRLGAIAARKGGTAVADYGRTLERDHTEARRAAVLLAGKYGLQPPTDMMPEAAEEEHKLAGLTGNDFDKELVRYMVKDHKNDISDFQKETAGDAPADVKALARETIPVLQKHLDLAKRLT